MNEFRQAIEKEKRKINQMLGEKKAYLELKSNKEKEIESLEKSGDILLKTQALFLTLGEKQRASIISEFEVIVSNALQYIMQEEIFFEIDTRELRGVPSVEFYIRTIRNGVITRTTLSESRGDGIVDIVSLALSIAVFINQSPKNEGPLILDEPCRQVSEKYKEGVGMFLKEIANAMDLQIFMITHIEKYVDCADHKYKVYLNGTKSVVEKI